LPVTQNMNQLEPTVLAKSDADEVPAISVQGLVKTFGHGSNQITALDDVSIDIQQNEFFTLLGPSGCGKTTLLRLIAGFELPDSGTVLLHGEGIEHLPPHMRPVNTVFQSYALFPHISVADNIGFGLRMLGWNKAKIANVVEKMLDMVRLSDLANRQPDQLSGGQQQRVALARALAPAPRVLLLDEPLAALDLKLRKEMQIELKRLQDQTGITFVFVTHDQEEALTMSDRIAVMSAGRVLQVGQPKEIYDAPEHRFVADFIGDINVLPGQVKHRQNGKLVVVIAGGSEVHLPDDGIQSDSLFVAVRPEKATLAKSGTGVLSGVVNNIVFFGSGTNIHVSLSDGVDFVVQTQGSETGLSLGDGVSVNFADSAAKILRN